MEEKLSELELQSRSSLADVKFHVQYMGVQWESKESLDSHILLYTARLKKMYGEGRGILLVTCQRALQPVYDLLKRKRACSSPLAASIWTRQLEIDLAVQLQEANLAKASVQII
jgi:hypothetical protein